MAHKFFLDLIKTFMVYLSLLCWLVWVVMQQEHNHKWRDMKEKESNYFLKINPNEAFCNI